MQMSESTVPNAVQPVITDFPEALRVQSASSGPGLRLFIRYGTTTWYSVGFKTRLEASEWIDSHGRALDWRVGYLFRLRGDSKDIQIVKCNGEALKA